MKTKFNTLDAIIAVDELQGIVGARVNQVYDIDNKTYLLKLNTSDNGKQVLLFESAARIHLTKCDWPKNPTPSGFTMKLRKHLKNKRITKLEQLGCDRIVHIQFGSGEVSFHIFIELFNRGNVVLTDYNLMIVSLLRSFNEGDSYHFAVHEKYPIERARQKNDISLDDIKEILQSGKKKEALKKVLLPLTDLGYPFLEHCLNKADLDPNFKIDANSIDGVTDKLEKLVNELAKAEEFVKTIKLSDTKGFILCQTLTNISGENFIQMIEFNPFDFASKNNLSSDFEIKTYNLFNEAVDDYFSKLESQKLEADLLHKEKEAFKKVNKMRENLMSRLEELSLKQTQDKVKAELIINNASLVDKAISIIRNCIITQSSWANIIRFIEEATRRGDPILSLITNTKFEINHICMSLRDPYDDSDVKPTEIDIDLALSAFANAKRFYDNKRHAAMKEQKTIDSQKKALKSTERKAREMLKTVKTQVSITKSRKVYWFEKFYWFISSENYLVIGGRDQKQNELIVKRYMKSGDLYVHADMQGASSVVIKNPSGAPVPPLTLDEAGHMAVCYSHAWDTKVLCRAWWVYHNQVSKTAPTGEYLTTGSFMIRGQKNYLLPTHLQLGFSFLFKIDESSAFRHVNERKTKGTDALNLISIDECNELDDGIHQEIKKISPDDLDNLDTVMNEENDILSNFNNDFDNDSTSNFIDDTKSSPASGNERDPTLNDDNADLEEDSSDDDSSSGTGQVNKASLENENKQIGEVNSSNEISSDEEVSEETVPVKLSNFQLDSFNITDKEIDTIISVLPNTKNDSSAGNRKMKPKANKSKPSEDTFDKNTNKPPTEPKDSGNENSKPGQLKRGQKSRLKKIKEKYKDQDEEEQKLRMSVLQSAGPPKKSKKLDKKSKKQHPVPNKEKPPIRENIIQQPLVKNETVEKEDEDDDKDIVTELDMLSLLTGQPHPEDEIMFALPVVAPYSAVLNNKYKVKLIPGLGKRGKSARSALEAFVRLKECTQREKDVIKSVNDQILSLNFPGKVKVVSAQVNLAKKKK